LTGEDDRREESRFIDRIEPMRSNQKPFQIISQFS
jgi:hypothetical protein